jgi:hypothetical protein
MKKIVMALVSLLLSLNIQACGPYFPYSIFFSRDTTVAAPALNVYYSSSYGDHSKPFLPLEDYLKGNIGVLRPQLGIVFQWIAYRHLINMPLSSEENELLLMLANEESTPSTEIGTFEGIASEDQWVQVNKNLLNQEIPQPRGYASKQLHHGNETTWLSFENCTPDAFRSASKHLEEKVKSALESLSQIIGWSKNQQSVFQNCSLETDNVVLPEPLSTNATEDQKFDYEYQTAASYFYAMDYIKSAQLFEEISQQEKSPYKDISLYLVIRSHFRGVLYKQANPQMLFETFHRLQSQIEKSPFKESILGLYQHIYIKEYPLEWINAEANQLLSSAQKVSINTLKDLTYNVKFKRNFIKNEPVENLHEFWQWIQIFCLNRSYESALKKWKESLTLPWLIACLENAPLEAPDLKELIKAAQSIPVTSPAYVTVNYQMANIYAKQGRKSEALKLINTILESQHLALATKNRFLDLRASMAKTYEEFLKDIIQDSIDENNFLIQGSFFSSYPVLSNHRPFQSSKDFDWRFHFIDIEKVPTSFLSQANTFPWLPKKIQAQFLCVSWTRAVLLGNLTEAQRVASALTEKHNELKDSLTLFLEEKDPKRQMYIGHLIILRFPALSIFVYPIHWRTHEINWDTPEFQSIQLPLTKIDTQSGFRQNWWNEKLLEYCFQEKEPFFLTSSEKEIAHHEWQQLYEKLQNTPDYFCKLALEWFHNNPEDPLLPEMMHRCVQMSRYMEAPKSSYEVFEVLHKHFKGDIFTKKTPYHYWIPS